MIVLGIWDGHDAGAALVVDGRVLTAINEERLTRRKLESRFPSHAIRSCLELAGVQPARVNLVAISTADFAKTLARWFPSTKERYYQVRRRRAEPGRFAGLTRQLKYRLTNWEPNAITRRLSRIAIRNTLTSLGLSNADLKVLDHHACHAAAAAWASGFSSCAVLTIDGVGDGLSSTISAYADGELRCLARSRASDSLGVFFEHATHLLNMRELEDEGKVMAIADHAAPVPDDRNPLLSLFTVRDGQLRMRITGRALPAFLKRVQWRYPNEQFAYMAQRAVEVVCCRLAADAVRLTGHSSIALAGGVASNVKANRRVRLLPGVDKVYVFPHMGDGGLALGAAVAAHLVPRRAEPWPDLDLGSEYSDQEIDRALERAGVAASRPPDLADRVADLLMDRKIVLWFQGRMEYGPRALGFRSILARPDLSEMRDRLNLVLKQRVWYQPFCPSMLESEAARVLSDYDGPTNRHMTMAYMVAPKFRSALGGVTSLDGSCRPHFVSDDDPGRFAGVLRAMLVKTGTGVVLNTSFNIHGEPLVSTPDEAIDVYTRTGADALAIGSTLIVRGG